jgi:hypothetical protein
VHLLELDAECLAGKATIGGQQKTYNNDFVQEALFLASQLECSERHAAGILDQVLSGYPNDDPVESAVKAVDQFHSCRRQALDTLRLVLESAMGLHPVNSEVRTRLTDYAVALVGTVTDLGNSKRGTLAEKILEQIDKSLGLLQQQHANQLGADSTTVIGESGFFKSTRGTLTGHVQVRITYTSSGLISTPRVSWRCKMSGSSSVTCCLFWLALENFVRARLSV